MSKSQIAVVIGGLILTIALFQLPRVVVENEPLSEIKQDHSFEISLADQNAISSLNNRLFGNGFNENTVIFADSLARLYLRYQFPDSAVALTERLLERFPDSLIFAELAGSISYKAFQMSVDATEAQKHAERAASNFEKVLDANPTNLSVKSKLGMTKVVSENPMSGVMILREVLEVDPEFRDAIFNLGLLAIQSGQYDRAIDRFEKLLELNENDHEAKFYLGVSLSESGDPSRAATLMNELIGNEKVDAALKATASNYLQEL